MNPEGLIHLEEYTEEILNPTEIEDFEWRRKIKSKSGNTFFNIKYYGEIHEIYNTLIRVVYV